MAIAIIDGDVLAFHACKPRWHQYARANSKREMTVKLDADGKKIPLEWTQEEDAKYLMNSWKQFKIELTNLIEKTYVDSYVMAVKGENNYRHTIYPAYKLQRTAPHPSNEAGKFVPGIRRLAVHEGYAVAAHGREADDLMRIWAEQCRERGLEYYICSIDKDLKCIPGKHYHIKNQNSFEIEETEALRFYYAQIMSGDPTDNIPGIPGIGPVKAERALQSVTREEEMQEIVVSHYMAVYDEDWYDFLLFNAKLIHLQKHPNDYFTFNNWPVVKELA